MRTHKPFHKVLEFFCPFHPLQFFLHNFKAALGFGYTQKTYGDKGQQERENSNDNYYFC